MIAPQNQAMLMQRNTPSKSTSSRRRFLGILGKAGAAALVAGRAQAEPIADQEPVQAAQPQATGNYRETEHIRRYYDCARYW